MSKASPIQNSFSAGEFSPKIYGRSDAERYKQGLATCENYVPTTEGPIERRPGEVYVKDAKDPSKPPTLIPFKFSATQNYILEFGDYYLRFYTNNGQIITNGTSYIVTGITAYNQSQADGTFANSIDGYFNFYASRSSTTPNPFENIVTTSAVVSGSILEIPTPYAYDQAPFIKWAQKEDSIFLHCSSVAPYVLQRFGNTRWTLKKLRTQDGPYLNANSYSFPGDKARISLEVKWFPVASPDLNGTITYLRTSPRFLIQTIDNASSRIRVKTTTPHNFLSGDNVFIIGVAGTVEANNSSIIGRESWAVTVQNSSTFILNDSVFANAYVGSGAVYPALLKNVAKNEDRQRVMGLTQGLHRYWGYIVGDFNPATNTPTFGSTRDPYELFTESPAFFGVALDRDSVAALPNSSTIDIWNVGVWNSSPIGYPTCGTFHQDRYGLAGIPAYPQQISLSKTGLYTYFNLSEGSSLIVADDNALQFNLSSADVNQTKWIKSDSKGLLSGTLSSEWNIAPDNLNSALTPTNINASEPSSFGSADIDAVKAGNALLYVQAGQRKVRELNYFFQVDNYRSTDLSELSEHITAPSITRLAVQKEPIPVVWALRSDGAIVSMTYNRDDQTIKAGWARHRLGGRSDSAGSPPKIKSIAVIPAPDGTSDQLWTVTQRFINGTNTVQIGYIKKFFEEETVNKEDAIYVDAAGTYDSPINISNITIGSAVVTTQTAHGFANDETIKITKVIGLNSSVVDTMGVIHSSNFVNYRTFKVASSAANSFYLKDFDGNFLNNIGYSVYVSGGEVRKLVSTISGLTWLKNEEVSVLADGGIHPNTIVNSAGVLALEYPAAVVQIGYDYNSDGKTLRPDAGSKDGSAIGKLKRVARAAFMLHQVGEFKVGPSFDKLTPCSEIELFLADQSASDNAPGLFSGIIRESLESQFDFNGQVCFRQSGPLPGMVQSLTLMLETSDV